MGQMSNTGAVLLTGATGFVGRYLLRDLVASGRRVAVLARDGSARSAEERVRALTAAWNDPSRARPAPPLVLRGDLRLPGLGLRAGDRAWLARHCRAVVHAAADVALRPAPGSDPWATNVRGTEHVLALCAELPIRELHHVSTAFVCGDRPGPVREDDLDCGQGFHNDYERTKFEAERRVRAARGVRATVYRPSVIVGDSRTGYTGSYHGFYRFLELAARLATPPFRPAATAGEGRRVLPLRLPFTGDEPRDLVPVDWVARAVVRIVNRPRCHGRTYHLVAPAPVTVREIKEVAADVLGIDGSSWGGAAVSRDPTPLEETFLAQLREYGPYLGGDPVFDSRNTRAALPWFPAPRLDRALLARLIRSAVADDWGRSATRGPRRQAALDCAHYVERFFPEAVRRSTLARLPVDVTVSLEVVGPGGGRWSFCCAGGAVRQVRRQADPDSEVLYRLDVGTFEEIVRGRQTPQDAFLGRRVEIDGDVEKALKLAVLFDRLVQEVPYAPRPHQEATDAAPLSA
jgi:nucleoside-diphosphate-sugar epimerase